MTEQTQKYNERNGKRAYLNEIKDILSKDNLSIQDYITAASKAHFKLERPTLALGLLMKGNSMCNKWNNCIDYMQMVVFGATDVDRLYSCNLDDKSRPSLKKKYTEHMATWFYNQAEKAYLPFNCSFEDSNISLLESSLMYAKEAGMTDLVSTITPKLGKLKEVWAGWVERSRRNAIRREEDEIREQYDIEREERDDYCDRERDRY